VTELIANWKASVVGNPQEVGWNIWFDEISAMLALTSSEAAIRLRQTELPWTESLLAAVNVLISPDSIPEDIFFAQARWLLEIRTSNWMREVGQDFCRLVERDWERASSTPALFRSPRITIPAIKEACATGEASLTKAVTILRAAEGAISTRLSRAMWDVLAELSSRE
jgi:hypothetical protein